MLNIQDFSPKNLRTCLYNILHQAAGIKKQWNYYIDTLLSQATNISIGIHLAIFIEPYLKLILEGKKTVESRFSSKKIAPFEKVSKNDVILLKRSGGPILGICRVSNVRYYKLTPSIFLDIKKNYSESLCIQKSEFWDEKRNAVYVTLINIDYPVEIQPLYINKRDRRGWVVLINNNIINLEKFL